MLNEYQLNSAFSQTKEIALAYEPAPEIDTNKLPVLPKNWLSKLQEIICQADNKLPKDILNEHCGTTSSYRAKKKLRDQLQLIYHRLQGNLDSELGKLSTDGRQAIIIKLSEEIIHCSEGLHNRVNIIVNSFHKPRNLAELVCAVRKNLVTKVASKLSNEVHAQNHVEVVAAFDGLGIKTNFSEDTYVGALSDISIRRALQHIFYKQFTPFHLPSLLITAFMEFIPELEIEKKHENGLSLQMIKKIISLIKRFLPKYINEIANHDHANNWQNYFKISYEENNRSFFRFVDIDWEKMYRSFFYALLDQNYFKNQQINTLLDSAYYNLFLRKKTSRNPQRLIYKLFKSENYADLLEQLVELKTRFPKFYENSIFSNFENDKFPNYSKKEYKIENAVKHCLPFIEYLTQQLQISSEYSPEIIQGFDLVLHLNCSNNKYLVEKIADSLLVKNRSGFNLLMLGALKNPTLINNIFSFLKSHKNIIDDKIPEKMLLMKNKANLNALMIATTHHPDAVTMILDFIESHIQDLDNTLLQEFFLEKQANNYNVLMLAASKQAESIVTILGFLTTHISRFANDTLRKLFTQQQNDSYTTVTLTARDHPDLLKNIFSFLSNHIKFDGETLCKLLFPENTNGACAALMLAVANQVEATDSILNFISANIDNFNSEILERMFLEKDQNGFTILMLAARYQPKNLELILNFINKHYSFFYLKNITELFLDKNQNNYNCLMFAAEFQPTSVPIILNFIIKKSAIFKPHLEQILFNSNKTGCHSMMLARHHPEAMRSIIDFIYLQPNGLIFEILNKIFFEKHEFGLTILMLAARDKAESLKVLFELINKKLKIFPKENLRKLLFAKNELDYNCLMFAARNQSLAVAHILNFIRKQRKIFSPHSLYKLLLEHDKNQISTLMIAARYQPEALKFILNFTQDQPKIFSPMFLTQLLLANDIYGVNALMVAAQYQPIALRFIFNFIQEQPKIFSHKFLKKFLLARDQYGVNVLMVAATYQMDVVELLLDILSKNIKHFTNEELYEFVFKKIHDKAAAMAIFFGGRYNVYKTVLSVTAGHNDPTAANALLKFIDKHIDLLGTKIFADLLTEKDNKENYIFQTICAKNFFTMKNVLNFIATSINDNFITTLITHTGLKSNIIQINVANFVYAQLAQWPIKNEEDKTLFCNITTQCSHLLIEEFNVERFKIYSKNMDIIAKIQLRYLLQKLEIKNAEEQEQPWYSRLMNKLMSTTPQELAAACNLEKIVTKKIHNKNSDLNLLKSQHTEFQKPKLILSRLFVAFKKIEELKADDAYEADREKVNWYFKTASPVFA